MAENTPNPENQAVAEVPVPAPVVAAKNVEKYRAMIFVTKFARLAGNVLAGVFILFALLAIVSGAFSESSFSWGVVNAGFYLLIGSVCVALVRGMGEVFELLLELEKRK